MGNYIYQYPPNSIYEFEIYDTNADSMALYVKGSFLVGAIRLSPWIPITQANRLVLESLKDKLSQTLTDFSSLEFEEK